MSVWSAIAIVLLSMAAMEAVAYLTHKYVMHGPLWVWHASHHQPRPLQKKIWWEHNDLFAILFASLAFALMVPRPHGPLYWIGWGMAGYGIVYALFHDGLVHGRIPMPAKLKRWPYLKHLIQAHRLHHASHEKAGAVSFGFMVAPKLQTLRDQYRAGAATTRPALLPADSGL